jgi:hypothetical protein
MIDPFAMETITLYVPITMGERTVKQLILRPPKYGDLLRADKYPPESHRADIALLSALSGESEELLANLIPEDVAICRVVLLRTYQRFFGGINLFEQREEDRGKKENPTGAGTPPATL